MDNRVFRIKNVPWRIIEGEAIVVDIDGGEIIHLNETGAVVWKNLDGKTDVSGIVDHVCEEFDVEKNIAETDVTEFLKTLTEKKVVECVKDAES